LNLETKNKLLIKELTLKAKEMSAIINHLFKLCRELEDEKNRIREAIKFKESFYS